MSIELNLIIPDTHRPFHCLRSYNLMLEIAAYYQPSRIILLGDYGDFYAIHGHGAKHPMLPKLLTEEVQSINEGLDELDMLFPKAEKIYIEGNHEYRLERYLCNQAPELFGVTDWKLLFKMPSRPLWKTIAYGPDQAYRIPNCSLIARHEPLGSSAQASAKNSMVNLTYGHIHRIEESHTVSLEGKSYVNFSVGWLGDSKKHDKVFNYVKGYHQWQHGFGLVWVDTEKKLFYHHKIHIIDSNTCIVAGKKFKHGL